MPDSVCFPTLRCKFDADVDAIRRPLRSPSSPALITSSNNITTLAVTPNSKQLSKQKKERPSFTMELATDDGTESNNLVHGEFLKSCLDCDKKMTKDHDIFMYSNFKAFCSQECRNKHIRIVETQHKPHSDSAVSEAFKNYDFTKLRRLGHQYNGCTK